MAKLGRRVVGFLALVFAIILLGLSIDVFDMSIDPTYDGYTEHEIYGGDAYTGIQNAAADTANAAATSARRMGELNNTVVYIGGGLLLGASFAFFVASAWMFVGCIVDTAIANRLNSDGEASAAPVVNQADKKVARPIIPKQPEVPKTPKTEKERFFSDNDDDWMDICCPHCGEKLSFLKGTAMGQCPNCDNTFDIK